MSFDTCLDTTHPHQWANLRFNNVTVESLNQTGNPKTAVLTWTDSKDSLTTTSTITYNIVGKTATIFIPAWDLPVALTDGARTVTSSILPAELASFVSGDDAAFFVVGRVNGVAADLAIVQQTPPNTLTLKSATLGTIALLTGQDLGTLGGISLSYIVA